MFKTIVQHMKDVEDAISRMNANAAFGFALACTERQWPVFERASEGRTWVPFGPSSNLRCAIDVGWEHLINGTAIPHGLPAACGKEVPRPEDIVDAPSSVAHTIANSIVDLLDAIEVRDHVYSHHLSGRNLGLLEMILDENGVLLDDLTGHNQDETKEITAVRALVEQEILHQNRDLKALETDSSASGIAEVRRASVGKSLFGEMWFF